MTAEIPWYHWLLKSKRVLKILSDISQLLGAPTVYIGYMEEQPSTPSVLTMNNNTIHPIEFALAVVLATVESILWLINELAGFHAQPTVTTTPTVTTAPAQTTPQAPTARLAPAQALQVAKLTKRQLQTLTGIKSSRYNKAALLRIATENLAHTH